MVNVRARLVTEVIDIESPREDLVDRLGAQRAAFARERDRATCTAVTGPHHRSVRARARIAAVDTCGRDLRRRGPVTTRRTPRAVDARGVRPLVGDRGRR